MTGERLRVAVANPLPADLAALLRRVEPRIELLHEPDLLPPMRHPADFGGDPSFQRSREQQERFERLLARADALYGVPDLDAAALHRAVTANPGLRWVHTMAAGGGSQVKAAGLTEEQLDRVRFTTSAGVHGAPLAEFAVLGVLAGAKDLGRLRAQQRRHEWSGRFEMRQVNGSRVLVVGLGGIGRTAADRLVALGADVVGVARHPVPVPGVTAVLPPDRIVEAAAGVDAIVAALPGTVATTGLIGRAVLEAANRGVTVVNVGRGTVIDEQELVAGLLDGRVGFAALDVFESEPLDPASPLWDLDTVLISPHTAGLTHDEERRIAELFADNATRLLDGLPLRNLVDTVEFY